MIFLPALNAFRDFQSLKLLDFYIFKEFKISISKSDLVKSINLLRKLFDDVEIFANTNKFELSYHALLGPYILTLVDSEN